MSAIQLNNGLWVIPKGWRLTLARDQFGRDVVGHVVREDFSKWKIDGRNEEFDCAKSAANELVKYVIGHPI